MTVCHNFLPIGSIKAQQIKDMHEHLCPGRLVNKKNEQKRCIFFHILELPCFNAVEH